MTESLPVPFDVKIMNLTASVLFLVCGAMVLAAAAYVLHRLRGLKRA